MKKNLNNRKEVVAIQNIRRLYEAMINSMNPSDRGYREKMMKEIFHLQREDGSWAVIDDMKAPTDIRVEYIYVLTYYATAALIAYMNLGGLLNESETSFMRKGLEVATIRKLNGSGFRATRYRIDALEIYKNAGLYEWMNRYGEMFPDFTDMIRDIISGFQAGLMCGRTFSDWNQDFSEEFDRQVSDYEEAMVPWVWYAAYGSNLSRDRFLKYIDSCQNRKLPEEDRHFVFPYNITFAGESRSWGNAGKAFLDDRKEGLALGRIYKIHRNQFEEIQRMEGSDYDKRIRLGWEEGLPVYTFTNSNLDLKKVNAPSDEYLQVILNGLKETYPEKSELVLKIYLFSRNVMSANDMNILSVIRTSEHGMSLQEIADNTGCPGITETRKSIKRLVSWKMIRQDGRSVRNGNRIQDREAVFYTNKENRDVIDTILLLLM